MSAADRFENPLEIQVPAEATGWERMYPYYLMFSEENRDYEESTLWFRDTMHRPAVEAPFDTIPHEAWRFALSACNSRLFAVPPAYGIDVRILGGYQYTTTVAVTDPERIAEREQAFLERAGYYYENWDELFEAWKSKMESQIEALAVIELPELGRLEPEARIREASGLSCGWDVLDAYDQAIENYFEAFQYHFEMLNIGYAAYLNFFQFCRRAFPGVADQTVANMVAGTDLIYFEVDDRLEELARLALDLDLADELRRDRPAEVILKELSDDEAGRRWVEAFEEAREPWFNIAGGATLYHHLRSWNDDLSTPWAAIVSNLDRLERGEDIGRPTEEVRERRDRVTTECRELLEGEEDLRAFDESLGLARTVAGYLEDHGFYHHDWYHSVFWNKIREFGDQLVARRFLDDREDIFYLNRWEVGQALYEAITSWAVGAPVRGQRYWKREVAERKRILEVLRAWQPPTALGPLPEAVTDPLAIMLWGVTLDRIRGWLEGTDEIGDELQGVGASPGVVDGRARVLASPSQGPDIQEGEILVCQITDAAWSSVFGRVRGVVTDIGGIMSHSAIVSREYGLPAVVGAAGATTAIATGDLIRVDGDGGVVTVLERRDSA